MTSVILPSTPPLPSSSTPLSPSTPTAIPRKAKSARDRVPVRKVLVNARAPSFASTHLPRLWEFYRPFMVQADYDLFRRTILRSSTIMLVERTDTPNNEIVFMITSEMKSYTIVDPATQQPRRALVFLAVYGFRNNSVDFDDQLTNWESFGTECHKLIVENQDLADDGNVYGIMFSMNPLAYTNALRRWAQTCSSDTYPSPNRPLPKDPFEQRVLETVAADYFGAKFDPVHQVHKENNRITIMRPEHNVLPTNFGKDPLIQYFTSICPTYHEGDKLVFMTVFRKDALRDAEAWARYTPLPSSYFYGGSYSTSSKL